MAKKLTLALLLLNASFLYSQEKLIVSQNSVFHELPGNHFLTSHIANGKVYLVERDIDGIQVWTDSLAFTVPIDSVSNFTLSRFGNTDTYAAILQKAPSQSNNTNIYQFSKLDLSTHTFSHHQVNTIPGYHAVIPLPNTDTSTYLFFPWGETGFETRSLQSDMTLQDIAPKDSISNFTSPQNVRFRLVNDTIWKNAGYGLFIRSASYNDEISHVSEHYVDMPSPYAAGAIYFRDMVNDDSLFVFISSIGEWQFNFLEKNLTVTNTQSILIPNIENYSATYKVKNIIVHQNKIYIFGYNTVYSNRSMVFVYDFSFNLVCKIPVSILYDPLQSVEVINDRVYFREQSNGFSITLYEINACMFTSKLEELTDPDLQIYPNPAQEKIYLQINEKFTGTEVMILDQLGKELVKSKIIFPMEIDVSQIQKGIYFVKVGNTTFKIVKD